MGGFVDLGSIGIDGVTFSSEGAEDLGDFSLDTTAKTWTMNFNIEPVDPEVLELAFGSRPAKPKKPEIALAFNTREEWPRPLRPHFRWPHFRKHEKAMRAYRLRLRDWENMPVDGDGKRWKTVRVYFPRVSLQ